MAVTLKIPFLWGVTPSAFVCGYTVEKCRKYIWPPYSG